MAKSTPQIEHLETLLKGIQRQKSFVQSMIDEADRRLMAIKQKQESLVREKKTSLPESMVREIEKSVEDLRVHSNDLHRDHSNESFETSEKRMKRMKAKI